MSHEEEYSEFDDLLDAAFEALEESGFRNIKAADYEDVDNPAEISGYVPDLQAENKKGVTYLFDVCLQEAFAQPELVERFTAFANHVGSNGGQFIIIVPEGDEGLATAFIEEYDVPSKNVAVWEA